jgi:hypothetical protein
VLQCQWKALKKQRLQSNFFLLQMARLAFIYIVMARLGLLLKKTFG